MFYRMHHLLCPQQLALVSRIKPPGVGEAWSGSRVSVAAEGTYSSTSLRWTVLDPPQRGIMARIVQLAMMRVGVLRGAGGLLKRREVTGR